jgi:hypothetical protein
MILLPERSRNHAARGCRRTALTLVEVLASVAITAILLTAIGSGILLVTRSAAATGSDTGTSKTDEVMFRIASDLKLAMNFTERTDTAVTFTVPDRGGNRSPETLRYAWSGVPGDPLTLEYNSRPPVTIAEDVHRFSLSYLLRTSGPPPPPPTQESEEMVLISHDDAPGGKLRAQSFHLNWPAAQFFNPVLPINTVSWKITRVTGCVQRSTSTDILVQIRPATLARKPAPQVLEQVAIPVSSLPWGWVWVEASFNSLSDLDPAIAHCVVVTSDSPAWSGTVQYELDGSPMTPRTHFTTSIDGGATWTDPTNSRDMRFYIYGTVTTEGPPEWP